MSAYHVFHSVAPGSELHATYYGEWKQSNPFHLDYCLIPETWRNNVRAVEIGSFEEWQDSDHRPLVVDIE